MLAAPLSSSLPQPSFLSPSVVAVVDAMQRRELSMGTVALQRAKEGAAYLFLSRSLPAAPFSKVGIEFDCWVIWRSSCWSGHMVCPYQR